MVVPPTISWPICAKPHGAGLFYLTGHGITEKRCEEILAVARKFFDLPKAAKLEVEMIHTGARGEGRARALNAAILGAKRKRDGNLKVERAMRGSW